MSIVSSSLALHQFSDVLIFQTTEDVTLSNGTVIPKGYVNATQMLKAASKQTGKTKRWSDYINKGDRPEFLTELSIENNQPITETAIEVTVKNSEYSKETVEFSKKKVSENHPLIIANKGGNVDEQGTWIHYDVAMNFSQWLSPKFAVWAAKTLRHVIEGNFQALTPEAKKAQEELQKIWAEQRTHVKETFWFLTKSIQSFYERHPKTEKYEGQHFSQPLDTLNIQLFGKRSKQIKKELGITKGKLNRDHFGEEALKKIEMIQRIAEAQINFQDMKPTEAVKFAVKTMGYNVSDFKK